MMSVLVAVAGFFIVVATCVVLLAYLNFIDSDLHKRWKKSRWGRKK